MSKNSGERKEARIDSNRLLARGERGREKEDWSVDTGKYANGTISLIRGGGNEGEYRDPNSRKRRRRGRRKETNYKKPRIKKEEEKEETVENAGEGLEERNGAEASSG